MEAVRAGDLAAFQALYERHSRAVFTFLLRLLGDRRTAEDLVQETFLRVFTSGETYRPTAAFRTWLFRIARNLTIDRFRRRSESAEVDAGGTLASQRDSGPSALELAEARQLGERLEAAIARLPVAQREVLLLSRFAGLSHEEVAQVTGSSPGAVRVALHRALGRLRTLLGRGTE